MVAPNTIAGFGGAEAGRQYSASNSGEGASGRFSSTTGTSVSPTSIITTGALSGARSWEIDPIAAASTLKQYGPSTSLPHSAFRHFSAMWLFELVTGFDATTAIWDFAEDAIDGIRRLVVDSNDKLQLQDDAGDQMAGPSAALSTATTYAIYLYHDSRAGRPTRDQLYYATGAGAWTQAWDVIGWGNANSAKNTNTMFWGSTTGKALPTTGGPYQVDEICIIENPQPGGIGSCRSYYKVPNANGLGANEWDSKAFGSVDEIPPSFGTDEDTSNNTGKIEYNNGDAESGDIPLAYHASGSAAKLSGTSATFRAGVSQFVSPTFYRVYDTAKSAIAAYRMVQSQGGDYEQMVLPNGDPITESAFNTLEPSAEITAIDAANIGLDTLGIEYMVEGDYSQPPIPGDVPSLVHINQSVNRAAVI